MKAADLEGTLHLDVLTGPLHDVLIGWSERYALTPSEVDLLARACSDDVFAHAPQTSLARGRGVALGTVKKQVQNLLAKTGDARLPYAVIRLLRAAYAYALEGEA